MSTLNLPSTTTAPTEKAQAMAREVASSNGSTKVPKQNFDFLPPSRYQTAKVLDIDDYFAGPRDMQKHSKLPFFMRVHGSVLPKMLLPLFFVGIWTTAIVLLDHFVQQLAVDTVLLTVLGFVVAFGLSFRCSTAYERYNDGRKYWSQLTLCSRNLGRLIWLNIEEREDAEHPEYTKQDLLGKIAAINLINAFAVALKHRLRFEPAVDYPDLNYLIGHLNGTVASSADQSALRHRKPTPWKRLGEHLGVTFAQSNPRKLIKRANDNLGNIPHEILAHLSAYINKVVNEDKNMPVLCTQNLAITDIRTMADILGGTERILNTPLPLAYSISISQITWAYIVVLPFQLVSKLHWIAIPATMIAAYIIRKSPTLNSRSQTNKPLVGLAMIGREIENPFGNDVNDLPLEVFCTEIAADLDVLTSTPYSDYKRFLNDMNNRPLYPLSYGTAAEWESQTVDDIREALRAKATTHTKSVALERCRTHAADIEAA